MIVITTLKTKTNNNANNIVFMIFCLHTNISISQKSCLKKSFFTSSFSTLNERNFLKPSRLQGICLAIDERRYPKKYFAKHFVLMIFANYVRLF